MVHPNDPQDLNRYAYCRNNPLNLVDPTGHGWLSKFFKGLAKGFASGFAGGLVTALLFPVMGPLAFAVGGAVTGAMSAALNGAGLQGILMGAAMGGLIGGVLGPLSMVNKGLAVALGAGLAIAGGVLAYQQGGVEGLAGYAGNVIGGIAGYSAGQATGKNIANGMRGSPQQSQAKTQASLRTDQKPEVSGTPRRGHYLKASSENPETGIRTTDQLYVNDGNRQITVIGAREDTLIAKDWANHNVLDLPRNEYTWQKNVQWLDSAIQRNDAIYMATDPKTHIYANPKSYYFDEINYLESKGYVQNGNYMIKGE